MLDPQVHQTRRRILAALLTASLGLFTFSCSSGASNPAASGTPSTAYEKKLVRRPGNGPEDGKVYVVRDGKKQWVVNASWFAGHGFKFPDDVHLISAAELDAIPTGDPIQ